LRKGFFYTMQHLTIAKEFILAAERHKVVCEKLLAMPELENLAAEEILPSNNSDEWRLLADIYYLSGYIIECSCCAAIYSFYRHLDPAAKKGLRASTIADDGNTKAVAFCYDKHAIPAKMYAANADHYLVKGDKGFDKFNSVFDNSAPNTIPILGGSKKVFKDKNVNDLLINWSANIRYKVEKEPQPNANPANRVIEISYKKIKTFFDIAKTIYEQVFITYQP
jgi:hypothetical protein